MQGAPPPWAYGPYPPPPYGMWMPMPVATERRSQGMAITGIALWAGGAVTTAIGVGLFVNAMANPCVNFAQEIDFPTRDLATRERVGQARQALGGCDNSGVVGLSLIGIGAAVGAAAIPIFLVGNSRVPKRGLPEISAGPTRGELRWRF